MEIGEVSQENKSIKKQILYRNLILFVKAISRKPCIHLFRCRIWSNIEKGDRSYITPSIKSNENPISYARNAKKLSSDTDPSKLFSKLTFRSASTYK